MADKSRLIANLKELFKALGVCMLIFLAINVIMPWAFSGHTSKSALATTCMSNLKQIGLGLMQYEQDYDDALPTAGTPGTVSPSWRSAVYPYIKSRNVFECPSRRGQDPRPDGFATSYAANDSGVFGHPAGFQGLGAFSPPGSKPLKTTNFPEPSRLVAVCEITGTSSTDFDADDPVRFGDNGGRLWAGHDHKMNACLADGHVIRVTPRQTLAYTPQIKPLDLKDAHKAGHKTKPDHAPSAVAADHDKPNNLWYRDGSMPLSPNGVLTIANTED